MENNIIKKFQEVDLLLNNNAYSEIKASADSDLLIRDLIDFMDKYGDNQFIITTSTIREYQEQERKRIHEAIKENPKTRQIRENQETPYEITMDVTNKSYTDGDIKDLNKYFNNRFDKLKKIIQENPEFNKVDDMKNTQTTIDNLHVIGIVNEIHNTKNGHRIIEIEDKTGSGSVII